MERLPIQSLSSTRLGNQIRSLDTIVEFLVAFNEIIESLDFFGEACAELDSVFINGKKKRIKKHLKQYHKLKGFNKQITTSYRPRNDSSIMIL